MSRVIRSVDISDIPELLRVAAEVEATDEPCLLRRGDKPVAIIVSLDWAPEVGVPLPTTEVDLEAFRSAAGAWKDFDVDSFVKYIYERRGRTIDPADE